MSLVPRHAATESLGSWAFRPRLGVDPRNDDGLVFRSRLTAAMRAGHAVDVSFRITLRSGPAPSLRLYPQDPSSARWVARVLALAYERHQWRWTREDSPPISSPERWIGRRSRSWPEPFRPGADPVATLDGVVLSLSGLPEGTRCDWSFRPIAMAHRAWWEAERQAPEPSPRRVGYGPSSVPMPPTTPQEGSDRPLFWKVRTEVACDPAFRGRAVRAVESATRSARGNGLRFGPRRWWESEPGVGFPMAESEVVQTLPTPACPAWGEAESRGSHRSVILPLGRTVSGAVVGPTVEAEQGRHLAVLGETGMGKSSLLVAISRRVAAGSGLILFDPLGETARAVRAQLPESMADRVMWIEPGEGRGLNALDSIASDSAGGAARQERQLNDLVHSLRRVRSGRYADSGFWGPRLEEMLTRALRAAAAFPGGTLVDAHTLLASGGRGFRAVPPEASEVVRELGDRIRSRPEDADGARRLLYEVTRSPVLVRMLCDARPALRAAELVVPGRVVLLAGDAAEVGEATARYLLSVYLALVWSHLLARPGGSKTFVVLDEAQWFVHESLSEMLRLGRRRNVHVVLATQSIASLPEGVSDAVWTNVSDFVAFRGSPDEAREFSRAARGIAAESILSLPRGEAALLLGKGTSAHWIRTIRIPGPPIGGADPPPAARPEESPDRHSASTLTPCAPANEVGTRAAGVDQVLSAIAKRMDRSADENPVRVSLEELRHEVDPTGGAVRAAGGILGRTGAIVRTGRDEDGACWWLDRSRFCGVRAASVPEDGKTDAEPSQPS